MSEDFSDQSDLEIIEGMLADYDLTPEDSIADLIEAILEVEGTAHA